MAGALEGEIGVTSTLIKGSNGVFDVRVDGTVIFSKHATGRFPTHKEILTLVRTQR